LGAVPALLVAHILLIVLSNDKSWMRKDYYMVNINYSQFTLKRSHSAVKYCNGILYVN
jgi:hypothetical protein